jgi:tetratricopeptide (TPR) repeat protein
MLAVGGEGDVIARRHAEEFMALARDAEPHLRGADQRMWHDRLERDHDNLRAALDWMIEHDPPMAVHTAFALWRFWQQRGYLHEARVRFEAMAARDWDLEPVDRARFAEGFGNVAYWQSDQAASARWYDEALRIWRGLGDRREIANALYDRAYADMIVVMHGDDPADAQATRTMLNEALETYAELGDTGGEGNVMWGLGSFDFFMADAPGAEAWFRRSLELHRAAGDRTMEAWSLHMIDNALLAQHRFEDALPIARHALQHFQDAGDISGITLVLDDLALIEAGAGRVERSGRLWGAARRLQQVTGTALADYVEATNDLYGVPTPRRAVGDEALARLAAEGAAMTLDEVVAYALDVPSGEIPTTHVETT